jgi:hypothetical protein
MPVIKSVTHAAENYFAKLNLYFAVAYLVIAFLLTILLLVLKRSSKAPIEAYSAPKNQTEPTENEAKPPEASQESVDNNESKPPRPLIQ